MHSLFREVRCVLVERAQATSIVGVRHGLLRLRLAVSFWLARYTRRRVRKCADQGLHGVYTIG